MDFSTFRGRTKKAREQFNAEERQKGHLANTCQNPGQKHFATNRFPWARNTVASLEFLASEVEGTIEDGGTVPQAKLDYVHKQIDYCQEQLDLARQHVEADLADRDASGSPHSGKRGLWFW